MGITLSPKTLQLLEEKIRSGGYRSADDVIHAALDALGELEARALDDQTLDAIDRAESQIERGEAIEWTQAREQVRSRFKFAHVFEK